MSESANLNVESMNGDNYREKVKGILNEIDGVDSVKINQSEKMVTVRYDENRISLLDIKQILIEEGYTVIEEV